MILGQRYHIIVEGMADPYIKERDGNYWIRTTPARYCNKFAYGPDERSGIIRYDPAMLRNISSLSEPDEPDDLHCGDEDHKKLIPWMGWRIGNPVNVGMDKASSLFSILGAEILTGPDPAKEHDDLPVNRKYIFEVAMQNSSGEPYRPGDPRVRSLKALSPIHPLIPPAPMDRSHRPLSHQFQRPYSSQPEQDRLLDPRTPLPGHHHLR
jgi:hypothetical protein